MAKRPATPASKPVDRLSIRLDLASGARIGPGKVAVLEEIARSGSISAAGRALHISYRRTWGLVEDINDTLGAPVVGQAVVVRYRAIEEECGAAAKKHLAALQRLARGRSLG